MPENTDRTALQPLFNDPGRLLEHLLRSDLLYGVKTCKLYNI